MSDYRVYVLEGDDRIGSGEWLKAETDEDAIALVRAKKLAVACEIWDRDRLVAQVPSHRA
jgi:hypothetical protein